MTNDSAGRLPWSRFAQAGKEYRFVDLAAIAGSGSAGVERLPYSLRILLENVARNAGPGWATAADVGRLADWKPGRRGAPLPMRVSRVLLPDSSGVPALADLAALRAALARRRIDPARAEPQVPVDLVVDHSVMVDYYGRRDALLLNMNREFERNAERYRFLKWAQQAFGRLRVVPPGIGIVHQVHLESLARVVDTCGADAPVAFPEFILGGDSHTPMINGLGVLGWGVGGVEAEAAMLDRPYVLPLPRFVGVRLSGRLTAGATTTDLVLTVTERLRKAGVVGAFVEFTGDGCTALTVPDRATVANMAPEYGATASYFAIDGRTLDYLRETGRPAAQVALVETYAKRNSLFREPGSREPSFDEVIEFDLSAVEPCVAGPKRPQDRVPLRAVASGFRKALAEPPSHGGYGLDAANVRSHGTATFGDRTWTIGHGALAIAAVTACTNTSNPGVMLAAGLLARNAVARGLRVPPYVKTSLAPGSRVVTRYLESTGLLGALEALGFYVVGYGCTTCSGKSGPLPTEMSRVIEVDDLVVAAVASSNRNFEGRIHREVRAAYLASPPLVVAFALAGRIDIDLTSEPLGVRADGRPVFLADLWPSAEEVAELEGAARHAELYRENYERAFDGTPQWRELDAPAGPLYPWDASSTYLLEPPFFGDDELAAGRGIADRIVGARALGVFGDSLTTDHISPAGEIPQASDAGRYLLEHGVTPTAFNAYTMRRGNHHVMMRGTFAHARIRNLLVPDAVGGLTRKLPEGGICTMFDAAQAYRREGTPVVVIGGRDYGMGSSRDWAAKGPRLLGVRAVIAESFERIHRANLIALGIVPLRFMAGASRESLGLAGTEQFTISGLQRAIREGTPALVEAQPAAGAAVRFEVHAAIESPVEAQMLEEGGIFAGVLNSLLTNESPKC